MTGQARAARPGARAAPATASGQPARAAAPRRPAPNGPPPATDRTRSARPAAHATSPPTGPRPTLPEHARRCGRCAATTRIPIPPAPLPRPTARPLRAAPGTTTTAPVRSRNRGPCSATTGTGAPPATPQPARPSHTTRRLPSRCGPRPQAAPPGNKPWPPFLLVAETPCIRGQQRWQNVITSIVVDIDEG